MPKINFKLNDADRAVITKIVDRAMTLAKKHSSDYDRMDCTLDIAACHLNGCRLDLQRLLDADDFNFAHDVWGIRNHLDRVTGQLTGWFSPRMASREEAAA